MIKDQTILLRRFSTGPHRVKNSLLVGSLVSVPPKTIALGLNQARGFQMRGAVSVEVRQRVRERRCWDSRKGTEGHSAAPIGNTRQQQCKHLQAVGTRRKRSNDHTKMKEMQVITCAKTAKKRKNIMGNSQFVVIFFFLPQGRVTSWVIPDRLRKPLQCDPAAKPE